MDDPKHWRRCSVCKNPIELAETFWVCNVSTCNRKRTALAFCSVDCWEVHLPGANHREAWAVEKRAPATREAEDVAGERAPRRRVAPAKASALSAGGQDSGDVLIVASRLKDFVKSRSGYNTSDRVLEPLSEIVRRVCERAIENARSEGRMTLLDRDIPDDL